jgi:hypothetical protein
MKPSLPACHVASCCNPSAIWPTTFGPMKSNSDYSRNSLPLALSMPRSLKIQLVANSLEVTDKTPPFALAIIVIA